MRGRLRRRPAKAAAPSSSSPPDPRLLRRLAVFGSPLPATGRGEPAPLIRKLHRLWGGSDRRSEPSRRTGSREDDRIAESDTQQPSCPGAQMRPGRIGGVRSGALRCRERSWRSWFASNWLLCCSRRLRCWLSMERLMSRILLLRPGLGEDRHRETASDRENDEGAHGTSPGGESVTMGNQSGRLKSVPPLRHEGWGSAPPRPRRRSRFDPWSGR